MDLRFWIYDFGFTIWRFTAEKTEKLAAEGTEGNRLINHLESYYDEYTEDCPTLGLAFLTTAVEIETAKSAKNAKGFLF